MHITRTDRNASVRRRVGRRVDHVRVEVAAGRRLAGVLGLVADQAVGAVVVDLAAFALSLLAGRHHCDRAREGNRTDEQYTLHYGISSSGGISSHSIAVTSYSRLPFGDCTVTVSP